MKRSFLCLILAACSDSSGDVAPDGGVDAGPDVSECGVPLETSGSLDLDLAPVRVTGRVTLDGAAPPQAAYRSPRIALRAVDGSTGVLVDLETLPSGQYDVQLLPGTYDVLYDEPDAACTGSPYPCAQRVVVRDGVAIHAAGVLDLDIRTVGVTGRVTLDGAPLPTASYSRPRIELLGDDGSTGLLVDLRDAPTGTFDVRVLAGTYDAVYAEQASGCTGLPYPCQRAPIRTALALSSDGVLDVDIKTVAVSGRVTLDGVAPPASANGRPRLELRGAGDATGVLVDLDDQPTGQYQTRVLAGTYDVLYTADTSSCVGTPYPCQRGVVVRSGVALTGSGVLDIDVKTVGVSGRITLDGAIAPNASYQPPVLELRGTDRSTGILVDLARGAAYQARVIPGTYDVLYSELAGSCTGMPWPCQQKRLVKAAVALQSTGVLDVDLRTVTVSGRITLDTAAPPSTTGVRIRLRGDDGSTGTFVDRIQPTYEVRVLPGSYDLLYSNGQSSCTGTPWPCQDGPLLRAGVPINGSGALDVDIATIALVGRVTFSGAAPPAASYARPRITLRGEHESTGTIVDLERVPTGMYQTHVLPGRYIVLYDETATCTGTPYPCQRARAIRGCGSAL